MTKKYEYHKQNDYPGERIAERKRVEQRELAADKRADARVAAKGRAEELKADNRVAAKGRRDNILLDSEKERSTAKATRVSATRDVADATGLAVIIVLIVLLLVGSVWGYMVIQKQSDQIETQSNEIEILTSNLVTARTAQSGSTQLSDQEKQVQLYMDFIVLTTDMRNEITALGSYEIIYSDMYQLCSGFTERENNVNRALHRFAQKQIVYYEQIVDLADKPQCRARIEMMRLTMDSSRVADEQLYVLTMNMCQEITSGNYEQSTQSRNTWDVASADAAMKEQAFDNAEKAVIECFA